MSSNNWEEDSYLDLLYTIRHQGEPRNNERTGVGTLSRFNASLNFELQGGFPLLTTKRVPFKSVASELLWFLEGSTDERRLAEIHYDMPRDEIRLENTIWTANADAQGKALGYENTDTVKELGPVYGKQWRNFNGVDQIAELIQGLEENPQSRRHILSAWNPGDLNKMALPPCHCFVQFYVTNQGSLNCSMYQRSADLFLGSPFNIASYSLLTHMIAQVTGLSAGEFNYLIGDAHIYQNHIEAVDTQLSRTSSAFPRLSIDPEIKTIDDFTMKDFEITDYNPQGTIKAPMAV
jgi:thymidylate synthase